MVVFPLSLVFWAVHLPCQHVKAKAQPGNFVSATDRVGVWDPGNPVVVGRRAILEYT